MSLIYLIGYRATGKSTIGALLAGRLGCSFYDLDVCLCENEGKSVAQIVAESGWPAFRKLESATLREITAKTEEGAVLATGGGVILDAENRQFMRDHGRVIWLHAPLPLLARRLQASPDHGQRPSLTGAGLLEEIADVMREREPLYAACAHCKVSAALSKDVVCASIISHINGHDGKV